MHNIKIPSHLKLTLGLIVAGICAFVPGAQVFAQITNPAIGELGGNDGNQGYKPSTVAVEGAQSGASFLAQFARLWGNIVTIGVIAVLIMFIWGGIEWITAGGDAGKVAKARDRMLQSALGLIILVSLFVLIGLLSGTFFGNTLDILKPKFYTSTSGTGGP